MPVSQFALCTLGEVLQYLNISSASTPRDNYIITQINRISSAFERETGVFFVARDFFDDLDGPGKSTLWIPEYPVLQIHTLIDDTNFEFTSTFVIPKDSYYLVDDGRVGAVRVYNNRTTFSKGKSNIRAEWIAGYADLEIEWDKNQFDFRERTAGTAYNVKLKPGRRNVFAVASMIAQSMSSAGLNSYHVLYDMLERNFRIGIQSPIGTGTLQILASTGSNASELFLPQMGYSTIADLTGASGYAPATNITPLIPEEIRWACLEAVTQVYDRSNFGSGNRSRTIRSESVGEWSATFNESAAGNRRYKSGEAEGQQFSADVQAVLDSYTRVYID